MDRRLVLKVVEPATAKGVKSRYQVLVGVRRET
jgi:hypothetical protein